ncbi:MAG: hypothetical protein GX351_04175 [Peptococcaceae bacterium]|nr:hypothetical protein [Peptococcaceae bacterium]
MKFRRKKIKREHTIIDGALDWLEELSKLKQVKDIIPGVIDVTNSKERGITYQYETTTGCKLLLKNGGSIQEAFIVTEDPQAVQLWVTKKMAELDLFQAALDDQDFAEIINENLPAKSSKKKLIKHKTIQTKNLQNEPRLIERTRLLSGVKEEYQLVEINQGLRDSLLDSMATIADLDNPTIEESLDQRVKEALDSFKKELKTRKKGNGKSR